MKFADIPQFTATPGYAVDMPIQSLVDWIADKQERGLQMIPDFQRGHVWTEAQQIAYVEFVLHGGMTGRDIYFNMRGFRQGLDASAARPYVCVDGLQRVTALQRFASNEIPAFGVLLSEYEDKIGWRYSVRIHVNDLPTRAAVLQWYLEFNSGGTVHTEEELRRVHDLLLSEQVRA